MSFCTAINCMDGRTQLPVIKYCQKRFNRDYVDMITEPGPNLILYERKNREKLQSILDRVDISINKHKSNGIAIVGHHDCAGNPASKDKQMEHLSQAVEFIQGIYSKIEVIGIWVDENWQPHEIKD